MAFVKAIIVIYFFVIVHAVAQQVGYDRDALQRLTEYRQQHRKTINGELCAAAFVQDGQTYTDCTIAKAPDGTVGREWCYVEYQTSQGGANYWNYCVEVVNYDDARAKAKEILKIKEKDMQNAAYEIKRQVARLEEVLHRYNEVCALNYGVVLGRIERIKKGVIAGSHTASKLQAAMSKINFLENSVEALNDDIKKSRASLLQDKTHCEGLRGYEDDPVADGLRGSYFNNPFFEKPATVYKDDFIIDFVWDEVYPVSNIPVQHFSVRWDGYVMAPETGKYTFITTADCGVRVFLEGSPIIVDRMPKPIIQEAEEESSVTILFPSKNTDVLKSYSEPQPLIGGKKYRIRVEYFHLSTLKWANQNVATIKLSWQTDFFQEQTIPRDNFFKNNPQKSFKISGLPGKYFNIGSLDDGAYAFVDSNDHIISDVPQKYEGAKFVKTVSNPRFTKLHFTVTSPSEMYLAAPIRGQNPFGFMNDTNKFISTNESISILRTGTDKVAALDQTTFVIYKTSLNAGPANFNTIPGTSYIMFFLPLRESKEKCLGETIVVSRTGSPTFADCTSSTYADEAFSCKAGLSGINNDVSFGVWRTSGGYGVGQYVSVMFVQPIRIVAFQFRTRDAPETWPRKISLEFPELKDAEQIDIVPGDHTYTLKVPRIASTVKVVITHMRDDSRPSDTGGSMSFLGVLCEPVQEMQVSKIQEKKIAIYFRAGIASLPPQGYLIDDGTVKAPHGKLYYGWDRIAKPVDLARCEDTRFLPEEIPGGIQFPPSVESDDRCATLELDCTPNKWSIDLPHYGTYRVTVEVGSPCGGEAINDLSVNGLPFIKKETLRGGQYSKAVDDVQLLTTATLVLTSSTATTLQSVIIEKL